MTASTRPTSSRTSRPLVPHRATTTLVTLGFPVVVLLVAIAVALSWRDVLPDPIAVHWGSDGVNGYGDLGSHLAAMVGITLAMSGFMWAVGFFSGRNALTRRLAGGVAVWFGVFMAGVFVGSLGPQRGLADAAQADPVGAVLVASILIACLAGGLAAWLMPADPAEAATDPIPADAPRMPLAASGQAVWIRDATVGGARWFLVVLALAMAAMIVISRQWEVFAILGLVFSLVFVLLARWTVTVDRTGLTVRPLTGRPRIHVPLAEVLEAEVVSVRPVAEFGGWGIRTGAAGRTGVVLRSGPALQVARTGGRTFVVTVDDAETGAALLNTLAARARRTD
ncbi:DUF1648 domain-containing protein [Pengzhenrongella phosphoraccumulans]|uniref:DUF1648 domain-containing protein n=1 Tax=Pengzhenrongella phosphoraccumulans TaxID=3114394 RepID=UPI00388DAB56